MFGKNSNNGNSEWMGVPDFIRADGPPWTDNILDPFADWGRRGTSTSHNLISGAGG